MPSNKRNIEVDKAPASKKAKRLNVKAALREGSLLTGVTLSGLKVSLQLAGEYTQTSHYQAINQALCQLYQTSEAFQARFEQPKRGIHAPVLQLKANHGYADEREILTALKAFAAPQKPLNAKTALQNGSLLIGVRLDGQKVTLQLAVEYTQASHYKAINQALYDLYRISSAFQAHFEQPKIGLYAPVLQLKTNHGYANGPAILTALKAFAAPENTLNVKADLHDGSLLTGVMLSGLKVTLQLSREYTQTSHFKAINRAFYKLYQISEAFQAHFEQPKNGIHAPVLRLKANHGYADENAILVALRGFPGSVMAAPLTIALNSSGDNLLALLSQQLVDDNNQPDTFEVASSSLQYEEFSLCAMPASELERDEVFSQADNSILNASSDDLLAILCQQLSDNYQQLSPEDVNANTSLQLEDIGSFLRLSSDVGLEANEAVSKIPDILEEESNNDYRLRISR